LGIGRSLVYVLKAYFFGFLELVTLLSLSHFYEVMTDNDHFSRTSSTSTTDSDTESRNEQNGSGHRGLDNAALEKQSTAASGLSVLEQRTHSVISRIRSREPGQTARFTHPLSHSKTSEDVIVDFDGPDDPYRPLNWGFRKKAVTTVLYGLTTMGMRRPLSEMQPPGLTDLYE
jgi:hypothetical protein